MRILNGPGLRASLAIGAMRVACLAGPSADAAAVKNYGKKGEPVELAIRAVAGPRK